MEDSSSNSNCTDEEDCISESESNLSLSVGYFPYEDSIAYEDTTSCEDLTSEGFSCHFLPPIQGTWGIKSLRRSIGIRDQIQDNPEIFSKLTISLAWDVDMGSDHQDSLSNLDLNGDNQWIGKWPQEKTKLTLCKLDNLMQKLKAFLENQKEDTDDDSVLSQSTQEEDLQPSSYFPLNMYQMISEVYGTAETPSVSAGQPKETDTSSITETTSCLNFRSIFHWLRTRLFSSLPGRKHPERSTKSPSLLEPKKRYFLRGKKIKPQESLESLQPITPDF
uniref:uncharacterized protein C12orf71 n=1 Tax=Ictidomys tridecemlineatus TaxID=43179 RepID=UPI001A9F5650|nr:uncharacterized protein C12orf71 [Ictidomys tridecemlineatus]XP_040136803.1 uncharacterized protein C12orf71 [Ictidomys tridecemlineatus]